MFSAATGPIGEYWVTLVNAQFGTPIIVGPTAVNAPMFYAYLGSGQLAGMLGGMKGAAEYEHLLAEKYPAMGRFYRSTRGPTAMKGMDVQTAAHATIIALILIGNGVFVARRLRRRTAASAR